MFKKSIYFTFLLFLTTQAQVVHQMTFDRFSHYAPDDWITYAPATFITSIDIGEDYVYFGTRDGGILRYSLYDRFWDYPLTTSNGLRSNQIYKIVYDISEHKLFAQTNKGIDAYNISFAYWRPAQRDVLPPQRRPDSDEIKSFRQNRSFNFPEFYRPGNSELPDFFTSRDFMFHAPDEIVDPYNRRFHFNPDRVVDKFNTLWLSTDGLGVGSSDFGSWTLKTDQHSVSNIFIRDVFLDKDGVWIGGLSNGREPGGITFWNDSLETSEIWSSHVQY